MYRGKPIGRAAAGLVTLCLLLAACSSGSGASGTPNLGIAVANISLNFAHEMVEGAQSASSHIGGVNVKAVGPPNTDGPAEEQLFQNLTTTNRDGIVVMNLDPPIFVRPEEQAVSQGIPVVALDTAPSNGSKVTFYVGNDNYELGVLLAQETVKRLGANPTGTIVLGEPNPGTPVLDSRVQGLKDTFAKLVPNVKVLGAYQTYSDPNQNYTAWVSLVHANPSALAFLGVGDADSYDLAKIKQDEHGKYLVAGTDVDPQTLQDVKAGLDFVTIDPEHFLKGYIAMALLIESVKDHKALPSGWLEMPGQVVDASNIDQILQREQSPQNAYNYYAAEISKILADPNAYLKPLSDAR